LRWLWSKLDASQCDAFVSTDSPTFAREAVWCFERGLGSARLAQRLGQFTHREISRAAADDRFFEPVGVARYLLEIGNRMPALRIVPSSESDNTAVTPMAVGVEVIHSVAQVNPGVIPSRC